jgi:carboxymethylenebutenolidase
LIVLLPAIAGVDEYALRVADRLAVHGYAVLALDYFARAGAVPDLGSPEKVMAAVASVSDDQVVEDVGQALQALAEDGAVEVSRAGVLGLCIGGSLALLSAAALGDRLSCVAAFYGLVRYGSSSDNKPRSPLDVAKDVEVPFVGHWGDADHLVPAADVEALREAMRGKPAEIYLYPGAGHAFHEDHRPVYRPAAAADAWRRTLLYFDYYMASSIAGALR